jgi:hypothetical protein
MACQAIAEPREDFYQIFRPTASLPVILGAKVQKKFDTCPLFLKKSRNNQKILRHAIDFNKKE